MAEFIIWELKMNIFCLEEEVEWVQAQEEEEEGAQV